MLIKNLVAIISDFDGTLAGEDWQISKPVVESIQKWIESGKYFSIATGKQYKHIQNACKILNLKSPQIVRGGAEIVAPEDGKVIHAEYINKIELKNLISLLKKTNIPFTAEAGNILYTQTGQPLKEVPNVEYKKIEEMSYDNIPKVVLWTDPLDEKYVEDYISNMSRQFHTIEIVKSYTPFLKSWQITSLKGTKFSAVMKLASILNVLPDQMIGIGDSYNDYPLLSACGYKVAMGNAHEELKEVADSVVPSYKEDGVAFLINKILNSDREHSTKDRIEAKKTDG
jgi:Cof subfamily protein (haloacid dehalogenase superfamily)